MYTKGKWEVAVNHLPSANYSRTLVFCNGKEVANCNHSDLSQADQEEHARLIAAAPELLEACKLLQAALTEHNLRDIKKRFSLCVADSATSKAIAKAEGKI